MKKTIIWGFTVCLVVLSLETFIIRTDESIFAECFINKLFGIVVLTTMLYYSKRKYSDIGFKKGKVVQDSAKGVLLCAVTYCIGFCIEFIILTKQGAAPHLEFYVTGFSLDGNVVKRTGFLFVAMCITFNIINVWMEEGFFRGYCITEYRWYYSEKAAIIIAAVLFGIWHIVIPVRSYIDGEMGFKTFVFMTVGYVFLSWIMGIKWGILFERSQTVWIGAADHFFNNCVATNLIHVVTETGADELQILRVVVAELVSFAIVCIYAKRRREKVWD